MTMMVPILLSLMPSTTASVSTAFFILSILFLKILYLSDLRVMYICVYIENLSVVALCIREEAEIDVF